MIRHKGAEDMSEIVTNRALRIGIDVGGTNTDAVLLEELRVRSAVKTATTADVTGGIIAALRLLLAESQTDVSQIGAVMIGTTHFTNAVVEAKRLMPTAVVRLGLPATQSLPPFVGWPDRLRHALGGHAYLCHGGRQFDGRPISQLDAEELRRVAADLAAKGIRSVAVSSVFSPADPTPEVEAAEILIGEIPDLAVSLSHEIGRIGMLERENATALNACLRDLAGEIVKAFNTALAESGIDAPIYLSQNDGTLMSVDHAKHYPVATFASGPTNSMRGAALLSGELECAVLDIGGTTADVGILRHGFPREAAAEVEIAGVRTNFRMPDVFSVGLGGGSLVRAVRADAEVEVGPESVGYELERHALIFGGDTLTVSDLAVAAGRAEFGDPTRVAHLNGSFVERALAQAEKIVASAIDRMNTSPEPIAVVAVGGGSVLLGAELAGASRVLHPDNFAVANAIGAAIAQVGAEVDRIVSYDTPGRDAAIDAAKEDAVQKAIEMGAIPSSVQIVEVYEVPLAYLPSNATRVRIKAVGDLDLGRIPDAVVD